MTIWQHLKTNLLTLSYCIKCQFSSTIIYLYPRGTCSIWIKLNVPKHQQFWYLFRVEKHILLSQPSEKHTQLEIHFQPTVTNNVLETSNGYSFMQTKKKNSKIGKKDKLKKRKEKKVKIRWDFKLKKKNLFLFV